MQQQEFIERVKERANIESNDEAFAIVKATLETLADHMAGNAPAKFAAQLPAGIAELITNHKSGETAEGEGFGVEEFVTRTANRAGINDADEAALRASAVLSVLQDAVSREDFDKMRDTFPAEYNTLFEQENSEAMSTRY